MSHKIKTALPWVALAAVLLAAVLLALSNNARAQSLVESGETRAAAEQVLGDLGKYTPTSLDDPAFRSAVEQAAKARYISALWLFTGDGQIVYAHGTPRTQGAAADLAALPVKQALASLPDGAVTPEQQMALLVSSAIQAEGEHSDVFRYRVQPIQSPAGGRTGYLALAYEVSPAIGSAPSMGYRVSLLALLAAFGIYWLSLVAWVYLDAASRGERAGVWAVFILIGNLVALIAYLLARRPPDRPSAQAQI